MSLDRGKAKMGGDWIEGSLIERYNKYTAIDTYQNDLIGYNMVQVLPETVGMCIDETDKNNKKVFFGDIIKIPLDSTQNELAVIKYGYHGLQPFGPKTVLGFYVDWVNKEWSFRQDIGYWFRNYSIEVVGNIIDNPEMLEGEK